MRKWLFLTLTLVLGATGSADVQAQCTTYKHGTIVGETWTAADSPYCVDGDTYVAGSGLKVQPGVQVLFLSNYKFRAPDMRR